MPSITQLMEEELFEAFDAGDAAAFEARIRERFAPDVEWMLWGWESTGLDPLLDEWLAQQAAFSPQRHTVMNRVDDGDAYACELSWTGTHSGPFRLPAGGEAAATGKEFMKRTLVQAWRGADGRIRKWHVLSAYPEIVSELSGMSPPDTNRALTIQLTKR